MELNKKSIDVQGNLGFASKKASISSDDMGKLWDVLQNPYKNPIGAVVREYASNAWDAHKEAGNEDQPIRVSVDIDDSGWFWEVEDTGVGMSKERVDKVFSNWLKSTKEHTNDLIGAFGMGSKSGLSYSEVVHITTRHDGTEYYYLLRKGEDGPYIDTISESSTSESNGTKIRIYIKQEDYLRFAEESRKQLSYFPEVYYTGHSISTNLNNYKIIETTDYLIRISNNNSNAEYSVDAPYSYTHMAIGNVAYPIDWDSLGDLPSALENFTIRFDKVPIALKFNVGDLDIIPTREDVKYTDKTKSAIKDKLFKVISAFESEYQDIVSNPIIKEDLQEVKKLQDNEAYYYKSYSIGKDVEFVLDFSDFQAYASWQSASEVYWKPLLDILGKDLYNAHFKKFNSIPNDLFTITNFTDGVAVSKKGSYNRYSTSIYSNLKDRLHSYNLVYYVAKKSANSPKRNRYLCNLHNISGTKFKIVRSVSGTVYEDFISDYRVRHRIKEDSECDKLLDDVIRLFKREVFKDSQGFYEDIEVPKDFEEDSPTRVSTRFEGSIVTKLYFYGPTQNTYSSDDRNVRSLVTAEDIEKFTGVIVYGSHDDKKSLELLSRAFHEYFVRAGTAPKPNIYGKDEPEPSKAFWVLSCSSRNFKHLENNPRAVHGSEFKTKYMKLYKKILSSIVVNYCISSNKHTMPNRLGDVSPEYKKCMEFFSNYYDNSDNIYELSRAASKLIDKHGDERDIDDLIKDGVVPDDVIENYNIFKKYFSNPVIRGLDSSANSLVVYSVCKVSNKLNTHESSKDYYWLDDLLATPVELHYIQWCEEVLSNLEKDLAFYDERVNDYRKLADFRQKVRNLESEISQMKEHNKNIEKIKFLLQ